MYNHRFIETQYFKSLSCFIFYTVSFGSSRALLIQWSRRDVWCFFLLIELSWTRLCESRMHLEVRVLIFRYLLSPSKLHFIFLEFSWTPMAPRWVERCILTPLWIFGFGSLNWNERNFEFLGVKKDERKLPNERRWHGGWDDAELEKQRDNLGTEDGVDSECTKMIILFILKVDSHIFHCWVSKILLCWDGKPKAQLSQAQNTTFPF